MDEAKARKLLLAARAAMERCSVAFSNEPEWQELHEHQENFACTVDKILGDREWAIRWPR